MIQPTLFAETLDRAATEATAETLPFGRGWLTWHKRDPWRPDQSERDRAATYAKAAIQRKVAETGAVPSKAWLAEKVRRDMGVKPDTKSALWIALFVARLLMLLSLFADEPVGQER